MRGTIIEDHELVLTFSDHWLIDASGARLAKLRRPTRVSMVAQASCTLSSDPVRLMVRLSIPLAMAAVFRKSKVDWSMYWGGWRARMTVTFLTPFFAVMEKLFMFLSGLRSTEFTAGGRAQSFI